MAALLLASGCTSSVSHPPPSDGRIERVVIVPHPEGVSFGFVGPSDPKSKTQLALADIQQAIPHPLPSPIQQGQCSSGYAIRIEFQDGASIEYGPCRKPQSIDRLDAAITAALAAYQRESCPNGPPCPARRKAQ